MVAALGRNGLAWRPHVASTFFYFKIFLLTTGYGLDDAAVGVPSLCKAFSLLHVVQTGSGAHPTSYTMGTGGFSPGLKRPGREANHSPPTSAELNKMWIYTSTPPYAFMA
jgi:hypothetical protein